MSPELMCGAAILMTVLLVCPIVLVLDNRQRRSQRQLALVNNPLGHEAGVQEERSIRLERTRFGWLRTASRKLLLFDPACPEAYFLPPIPTMILAAAAGFLDCFVSSELLPFPVSVLSGVAVAAFACRNAFGWQRRWYTNQLRKQLPDALQFVASAVSAGLPVLEAFRDLAREAPEPTRTAFRNVLDETVV